MSREGDLSAGEPADADVLLLSLGTTIGLRAGDEELAALMRQAGASVKIARVRFGLTAALRRAYPLIDLVEATAARRALAGALERAKPRAVIFSTSTCSQLAGDPGVPYAIRLDSPARLNRPGPHNLIQHALERRQMSRARLIMPFSDAAAAALPPGAAQAVVVRESIVPSGPPAAHREPLAVAYTPDPKAKGLDIVAAAWAQAELAHAKLEVFGISPEMARRHLARRGVDEPPGIAWRGAVAAEEFRSALRRAQVFFTGARWEDYGRAQMEALADGALLVCGPTGGAFEALIHARELAPQLCAESLAPGPLANALRAAFAMPEQDAQRYRRAAAERLSEHRPEAIRAVIADRVLPTLLG